jgi:hypothetical protein
MISVIWVSLNLFEFVQLQITKRNSTLKKSLRVKALSGGIQAAGLKAIFTCCGDKHGSVECDKVSWEWENRGYMQIEEERSENGKGGNPAHFHLIQCISYFNRCKAEYPGTHR